ncbi:competence protein A [bacterium BMS3Abin05]|nr:competence protein A [bacterium BMS3Abin05]
MKDKPDIPLVIGRYSGEDSEQVISLEEFQQGEFVDFNFLNDQTETPNENIPSNTGEAESFGQELKLSQDELTDSDGGSIQFFDTSAPDFEFLQEKETNAFKADEVVRPEQDEPEEILSDQAEAGQAYDLDFSFLERPQEVKDNSLSEEGETLSDAQEETSDEGVSQNFKHWGYTSSGFSRKWSIGKIIETGTYLGLDLGRGSTKYVLVKKKGREKVVQAFGILENPRGKRVDVAQIVEKALDELEKRGFIKAVKINLTIYGPEVGFHRMGLPPLKSKELHEAVKWTLKKKFDFQNKALISDYMVLKKKTVKGVEHSDILASLVSEEAANERIKPFLERKIAPWHVRPLPSVLWALYRAANIPDASDRVAMVDIGAKKTLIAFIREGVIEFAREIPTGGDDITEGMTGTIFYEGRAFQLTYDEAEEVKRTFGFPLQGKTQAQIRDVPVSEIGALMRPYLERLTSEIQRSIDYYRENFSVDEIDRVYLLGGTAGLQNLVEFFKNEIDVEIKLFQYSTHFPLNLSSNDAQFFHNRFLELAVAVGLAVDSSKSLNLLPESLRKVDSLKLQRRLFIYVSFLTIILILFLSGTSFFKATSLKNEFRQSQLEYKKIQPRKQHYDALQIEKKDMLQKKQVYQNELILDNPLPQILKMVSYLMPPEVALTGMSVSRELISAKTKKPANPVKNGSSKGKKTEKRVKASFLHLNGIRYHPRPDEGIRIADFMLRLRNSGYFRSVTLANQSFSEENDELRFEIICQF